MGLIGLIHGLDYEKYPEQHCAKTIDDGVQDIITSSN